MSVKSATPQPMFALPQDPAGTSTANASTLAPEMEQILTSLTSYRSVLGYMLLSRGHPATLIRHSGVVFEGEQGRRYAHAVSRIVDAAQDGLDEVAAEGDTVSDCFLLNVIRP